jgi:hypothetical protein
MDKFPDVNESWAAHIKQGPNNNFTVSAIKIFSLKMQNLLILSTHPSDHSGLRHYIQFRLG